MILTLATCVAHIKYHTCQTHVNCHFVFFYRQMWMYSKMPGSWYAVSSKRVNSHNVIDIQAGHDIHRSITNCKASQASPYSHVKHSAFYILVSQAICPAWKPVYTPPALRSTFEYLTFNMQHLARLIVV